MDDVHAAIGHYVDHIPYGQVLAMATHVSTDIDFRPVDDRRMSEALARRDQAGLNERDTYASYVNEAFLTALENRGEKLVFQFSFGAEPLPHETASRLSQRSIAQLAEKISRGQYGRDEALSIAGAILYETPQSLLRMVPRGR